ncbi:MAG: hypothetical protein NTV85_28505 [Hyphomicrobiales bacterium]|nr:hypothetical protein [Hyphomicrobiales bacterium]
MKAKKPSPVKEAPRFEWRGQKFHDADALVEAVRAFIEEAIREKLGGELDIVDLLHPGSFVAIVMSLRPEIECPTCGTRRTPAGVIPYGAA